MQEEKRNVTEETVQLIDLLEAENEEKLTKVIEAIQDVEQKSREIQYSLEEIGKDETTNMNFFSPVGVYEEGEERRELLDEAEQLKNKLEHLTCNLEQYRKRKEQLNYLKQLVKEKMQEEETPKSDIHAEVGSYHILENQEYDRNRIARDLHDSTVQSLTSLVHKTELCMRLMDIDAIRVKLELQTMIETIRSVIQDMREIIYDLRPMSLNSFGLGMTIDSYCLQLQKSYGMEVNVQVPEEEPYMLSIWKVTLYRILQEACSNIIKHAKATKIDVELSYKEEKVHLIIKDNGIGFCSEEKTDAAEKKLHGFGLSIMKERVALLGGIIDIVSEKDKGTTITVEVPIKKEEEVNGTN